MSVEPWQVEDYRAIALPKIFERLGAHEFKLDKEYFLKLASQVDSPEELTNLLLEDEELNPIVYDQVYLLIFELWRRFITDLPCLSIFCDEFDHQAYIYDENRANIEAIQDAIASLQNILDENTDKGLDPHQVFKLVASHCAHDLESFIYDYIYEQIDNGNVSYATELVDGFKAYMSDSKWYDFLRTKLLSLSDEENAQRYVKDLIDRYKDEKDLEFNFEVLSFMVKVASEESFNRLAKKTLPLITIEVDFHDLLEISIEFYHYLDLEVKEQLLKEILAKRSHLHLDGAIPSKDPVRAEYLAVLKAA